MKEFKKLIGPVKKKIDSYIDILIEENKKINLFSRKTGKDELIQLMNESLLLERFISNDTIIDAGSGNGILGVPISIIRPYSKVFLVEPRKKKSEFLKKLKETEGLDNLQVERYDIREYMIKRQPSKFSIISRGFPNPEELLKAIKKRIDSEAIIISSKNRMKKCEKLLEMFNQNIYNIPYRNLIKVFKLESVSRETKK